MNNWIDILKLIKVMCDMDDVITHEGFLYLTNQFLGTHYIEDDFDNVYIQSVVPEELHEEYFKYFFSKNVYDYCVLDPYAKEVLKEINRYYDFCIGTSYLMPEKPRESGVLLQMKYDFLLDQLPFLTPENIIMVNAKRFLSCQIRIDDRIGNLDGAIRKYLYTKYHNKRRTKEELDIRGIERVNNLDDVGKILLK